MNTNLLAGTGGTSNWIYGLNTSLELTNDSKNSFGIGTGIEGQYTDSFLITSIPIFLNSQMLFKSLGKQEAIYLLFRPGISLAYSAKTNINVIGLPNPTVSGRNIQDINELLKNDLYFIAGIGYEAKHGAHIELFYRNQPSNLYPPFNLRYNYLGLSVGYRIN